MMRASATYSTLLKEDKNDKYLEPVLLQSCLLNPRKISLVEYEEFFDPRFC